MGSSPVTTPSGLRSSSPTVRTSLERLGQEKEKEGSVTSDSAQQPVLDVPPDGGWRAWATVVGVHLISFIAFGVGNVWGLFQVCLHISRLIIHGPMIPNKTFVICRMRTS
jgi:hypothetical protein